MWTYSRASLKGVSRAAVMSANERSDTVLECISLGAEDYLLKPVTKKEVQNIWQHVYRRSKAQRPAPAQLDHVRLFTRLHQLPAILCTSFANVLFLSSTPVFWSAPAKFYARAGTITAACISLGSV